MKEPLTRRIALKGLVPLMLLAVIVYAGCGRNARLADHDVHDVKVGPVAAYGQTLDESATPKQVVYVLLRAIVDDYGAGQDRAAREKVLDLEMKLSAADHIKGEMSARKESAEDQVNYLYKLVHSWAPTLGFYRASFGEDFEAMSKRMLALERPAQEGKPAQADVLVNLDHPNGDPNSAAVARIRLIKTDGFWRIWWVGFDPETRHWQDRHLKSAGA